MDDVTDDMMAGADLALANPEHLLKLVHTRMPFGRYQGRFLIDLPEPYVVWLVNNALPKGELGSLILEIYEIKANGLEGLLRPLRDTPLKSST